MANGGILISDIAGKYETLTVNTEATNFPKENLVNGVNAETWRSTGLTGSITFDFGSVVSISSVAIINTNISETNDVKLQFSSDNFTTIDEEIDLTGEIDITLKNLWAVFPEKTYRYIRLSAAVNSGYIEIGELFLGEYYQFSKNYNWDYQRKFKVNKYIEEINGQFYERQVSEMYGYEISFSYVPETEYKNFQNLVRAGYKVFVPDMDDKACYYGIINEDIFTPEIRAGLLKGFTLTFWENALEIR